MSSLRLHGQHSFHSYPLMIRAGGLIDALGPEVARRAADPRTGDVQLECEGFNDRNQHPRKTPCDQDFLRKLAKDTKPDELEDWCNRHAAAMFQELGAFDAEGLFIADGTYLFVPDNPRYEGSRRLLPDGDRVIIYRQQCFGFFTLLEHTDTSESQGVGASPLPTGRRRDTVDSIPPIGPNTTSVVARRVEQR